MTEFEKWWAEFDKDHYWSPETKEKFELAFRTGQQSAAVEILHMLFDVPETGWRLINHVASEIGEAIGKRFNLKKVD